MGWHNEVDRICDVMRTNDQFVPQQRGEVSFFTIYPRHGVFISTFQGDFDFGEGQDTYNFDLLTFKGIELPNMWRVRVLKSGLPFFVPQKEQRLGRLIAKVLAASTLKTNIPAPFNALYLVKAWSNFALENYDTHIASVIHGTFFPGLLRQQTAH